MLIIADKRIPDAAKNRLRDFGMLYELSTNTIVDDAISGHPDLFICQVDNSLIISPQAPSSLIDDLASRNLKFKMGNKTVEKEYPGCVTYNAVITEKFLIHHLQITDDAILEAANELIHVHVNQGFTRCNLLPVGDGFITSDSGIYKKLQLLDIDVLLTSADQILLPGYRNGCFGGCCGIYEDHIFILGKLSNSKNGNSIREFIEAQNYKIVELYNGPLFDGGSIFFI